MKTEVKKIDQHKRELSVEVQGEVITEKFNQVYDKINKEAKVPGFRAGKVPRDILEKHYSAVAQQEALKELLPEVYNQALDHAQLEPVNMPEISEVNLGKENLSFKANLEVKPNIDLKNYLGLKVGFKALEASEEEINKAIDNLKKNYTDMPEEDLAHSLGYPGPGALKNVLEKQIYLEKARSQQAAIENKIIEELLGQVNFQAPSSLISQQLERFLKQAEVDLALRGMNKEDIEKQRPKMQENLLPQAEKQVRVFLVLEEVARRENIPRDDKMIQKVIEFLLRKADWKGGKEE